MKDSQFADEMILNRDKVANLSELVHEDYFVKNPKEA
jgi:hypothetical protein